MNFLFPILAAVLQGASVTLDKVILSMRRVNYRTYIAAGFPIYFVITFFIFLIFRPPIRLQDFEGVPGLLLALIILLTAGTNALYYRAMGDDGLGEIQTVELFKDIPIIIAVSILFADERKPIILVVAVIASAAMVWSHWERHHFKMKQFTARFLLWTLFAQPLLAIVTKTLLFTWHPLSLQLMWTAGVTLLLVPWFCTGTKNIPKGVIGPLILTNALSAIAWLFYFTSYKASGVVYTILIYTLLPFLVYLTSMLFLKERFRWKRCAGFIIVLICVVIAQLVHGT